MGNLCAESIDQQNNKYNNETTTATLNNKEDNNPINNQSLANQNANINHTPNQNLSNPPLYLSLSESYDLKMAKQKNEDLSANLKNHKALIIKITEKKNIIIQR